MKAEEKEGAMPETVETSGPVCVRCGEQGAWRKLANGWWFHDRCHVIWLCVAAELGIALAAVPAWLAAPDEQKHACEKWAEVEGEH